MYKLGLNETKRFVQVKIVLTTFKTRHQDWVFHIRFMIDSSQFAYYITFWSACLIFIQHPTALCSAASSVSRPRLAGSLAIIQCFQRTLISSDLDKHLQVKPSDKSPTYRWHPGTIVKKKKLYMQLEEKWIAFTVCCTCKMFFILLQQNIVQKKKLYDNEHTCNHDEWHWWTFYFLIFFLPILLFKKHQYLSFHVNNWPFWINDCVKERLIVRFYANFIIVC